MGNCPQNVCNPAINSANNRVVGHSFDNAGNTTVDAEGRQFFYDGENKQKEVRDAQNNIIGQYLYDGDGKRVKKLSANDTTIFVYDAAGKLASEYLITASQSQTPTTSYLTNDTLGSPRVTTDSSGNVISRRDFRPYGEEIYRPNQGTDKVRQKFTSYERDIETNLDFAQARMYATKLGRFSGVDPFNPILGKQNASNPKEAESEIVDYIGQPQHWNRYSYALNNPLHFTDPDGFNPITVKINIIFNKRSNYTEEEIEEIKNTYVADLQKNYAQDGIDINFDITYTTGTASEMGNQNIQRINSGKVDGAINVFFNKASVGPSTEVTDSKNGIVWIDTSTWVSTRKDLTHGVTHALGIAQGKNGYPEVDNTSTTGAGAASSHNSSPKSAESTVNAIVTHLYRLRSNYYSAEGRYGSIAKIGEQVIPKPPNFSNEYKILREGAKKYEKK